MTHTEIVQKLIGNIQPLGDSSRDPERFENLKAMCELVNNLVTAIDDVAYQYSESHEYSVKEMGQYADNFLTKTLGIK
jgi:hypothetical protein